MRKALDLGKTLPQLSLAELKGEHAAIEQDVYRALDPETAVERRALTGGPARANVLAEVDALRARLRARGVDPVAVSRKLGIQE